MNTIAATPAKARAIMVRQPVGTNHFQLRAHQPRRGGAAGTDGIGGGGGGDGSTQSVTTSLDFFVELDPVGEPSAIGVTMENAYSADRMLDDQRKRIVLIDDHALVRQGLERLLNLGEEFVVCEEAGDADQGRAMVRETQPDAVVVDVELPGTDGIE